MRRGRDLLATITAAETLVIVGVVLLLAAVLVPTVRSQFAVSSILQARFDVDRLQAAFTRFYHDNGFMPGAHGIGAQTARQSDAGTTIMTLITRGNMPLADHDPLCTGWLRARSDWIDSHLIENAPDYALRDPSGRGWDGPYLNQAIDADPWGNCYVVNVGFFDDSKQTRDRNGRVKRAVFILSAGPDGRIDTPWTQPITTAQARGDDVTLRLQ